MELSVVRRVAQIVNEWKTGTQKKVDGERAKKPSAPHLPTIADAVEISPAAGEVKKVTDIIAAGQTDPDREQRVANLRELVSAGKYEMSGEMLDSIAEKIAGILV